MEPAVAGVGVVLGDRFGDAVERGQLRPVIDSVLPTGVRAIDALLTVGRGQRMGLPFARRLPGCTATASARGMVSFMVRIGPPR